MTFEPCFANKRAVSLPMEEFREWTGFDLVYDFYRLRNADRLAIKDIGTERIKQYQLFFDALLSAADNGIPGDRAILDGMLDFAEIFHMFLNGAPADHFKVDLNSGVLEDLKNKK